MNKAEVFDHCGRFLERRQTLIEGQLLRLKESLLSETKSSAGDKHETGRALIQLEQERLGKQLLQLGRPKTILQMVDITKVSLKIVLGSLVKTSTANYFIAISAGMYTNEGVTILCISPGTPIAQKLLGKEQGDSIIFNGKQVEILEII